MLSKAQEKLIRSLHQKKNRIEKGLCLVEGKKVIDTAGHAIDFQFTPEDTDHFAELVTTETPQSVAAVATIPTWNLEDVLIKKTVVILDNVQDPGNIGSLLRLALGFDAGLLFVESADPTSPKVVRSSVGALFHTPWIIMTRPDAEKYLASSDRPLFRLEKRNNGVTLDELQRNSPIFIIAGSEGRGIQLSTKGQSLAIEHSSALESLNVTHAVTIALHARYTKI